MYVVHSACLPKSCFSAAAGEAAAGPQGESKEKAADAEGAQPDGAAGEGAAKGEAEAVTVVGFNEYMSPQLKAEISASADVKALKITFGAAFMKKLECQLNVVVWDIYHALTNKEAHITVNLEVLSG